MLFVVCCCLCQLANQHHIIVVQPHFQPTFDAVVELSVHRLGGGNKGDDLFGGSAVGSIHRRTSAQADFNDVGVLGK